MIIKNSNLRRDITENRYKILAIIVAIILVLCLIQSLNELAKTSNKKKNENKINTNTSSYKPEETAVLGSNVQNKKQEQNTKVMDEFIKYCNSKEIEKAYNLLTDECKIEKFSNNIENFKTNYVEKIFTKTKTYNMQAWINGENPTYKVRIIDDVLATGDVGEAVEDYITIIKKDNDYKINLSSYIGTTNVNKQTKQDDIIVTFLEKESNMEYEIYNIQIENKTKNTMLLDTKTKPKSVYATGSNGATYTAFMYEIEDTHLTIEQGVTKKISIKINKIYSPNIGVDKLTFTDVIENLEEYNNTQNKNEYPRKTIEVNM